MARGDDQRIAVILDARDEVRGVVALRSAGTTSDKGLILADERLLEISCAAAGNVSEAAMAAHPAVDWQSISRLRIVLAHHYHRTDPDLIWSYAVEQAPALASAQRV